MITSTQGSLTMHLLILSLFIACLLAILSKIPLLIAMKNQPGGYNNCTPRLQQDTLTGFGARALAAHKNSFESLLIFAAAILTAIATGNATETIQRLAMIYLLTRVIYHAMYLLNWATLRSLIWTLSTLASLSILWLCLPA